MTKQSQIKFIREKCIDANPEILKRFNWDVEPEIRLADVFLAMKEQKQFGPGEYADLGVIYWNLRADDLREQSDETVEFIHQLLK